MELAGQRLGNMPAVLAGYKEPLEGRVTLASDSVFHSLHAHLDSLLLLNSHPAISLDSCPGR